MHLLDSIYVYFTLLGYLVGGGGRLPMDLCTTCSCSFSPWIAQIKVIESSFFDIVATHNDHPSYVKHVLGSIMQEAYTVTTFLLAPLRPGSTGSPRSKPPIKQKWLKTKTTDKAKMAEECINCTSPCPTTPHTNPMGWRPENTFLAQNRKKNKRFMIFNTTKRGGSFLDTFDPPPPPTPLS